MVCEPRYYDKYNVYGYENIEDTIKVLKFSENTRGIKDEDTDERRNK